MDAYISLKLVYGLFFANRFLTIRTTGFALKSFDAFCAASSSCTGTLLAVRRSARYKARAAVRCRELRAAMNVERDMSNVKDDYCISMAIDCIGENSLRE